MFRNIKQNILHYVVKGLFSAAMLALLPACWNVAYQPQVPEHLQDRG